MEDVYHPGEDSYLLQKYVEKYVSGKVLDLGTGSGIQAITAARKKEVTKVLAVDVNPAALILAERRAVEALVVSKIDFQLSNLFENVTGEFDWIIFNPPYLPSEGELSESSWSGGETGREIIISFLNEARNHLAKQGSILMIYSSFSNLSIIDFDGYTYELLEEIRIFFEEIYCIRLIPSLCLNQTPQELPRQRANSI